jgi:hypothetical protein
MFTAVSTKMAMDLELYLDTDTLIPELALSLPLRQHKEIKRRLWWFLYLADSFVFQSNGVPKWIDDSIMRIPLPVCEDIWTRPPGQPSAEDLEEEETQIAITSSNDIYLGGIYLANSSSSMLLMVCSVGGM